MRALCAIGVTAAMFLAARGAAAGEKWTLNGGETVAASDNLVYGEFGFPDVSLGIQHGFGDRVDAGARLSLIYGAESTVAAIQFGMGLRFPIRFQLTRPGGKVSAMLHIDPGIKFYTTTPVIFGIQWPVGLEIGYRPNPDAILQLGLDLPMTLAVTPGVGFTIAPMLGPGFEYRVAENVGIGLNTRFGPAIVAASYNGASGSTVQFAFVLQAGAMYHF
jgi:hypothetical protein